MCCITCHAQWHVSGAASTFAQRTMTVHALLQQVLQVCGVTQRLSLQGRSGTDCCCRNAKLIAVHVDSRDEASVAAQLKRMQAERAAGAGSSQQQQSRQLRSSQPLARAGPPADSPAQGVSISAHSQQQHSAAVLSDKQDCMVHGPGTCSIWRHRGQLLLAVFSASSKGSCSLHALVRAGLLETSPGGLRALPACASNPEQAVTDCKQYKFFVSDWC